MRYVDSAMVFRNAELSGHALFVVVFPSQSMAKVVVDMTLCDKTHKITVNLKEDGNLSLHIATDCKNIKEYAKKLGDTLTMDDVVDWKISRIYDHDICSAASITCLVPAGVMNAAWLELGMISKNRARDAKTNCIRFVKKNGNELSNELLDE